MKDVIAKKIIGGEIEMRELTIDEVNAVGGGDLKQAGAAFGLASGIGAAAFGAGWGTVAVGAAFMAAPFAAAAMLGLAAYGGYTIFKMK